MDKSPTLANKSRPHYSLWMLLPALANRETAKEILSSNQETSAERRAYLQKVVDDGDSIENILRRCHYYEQSARGLVFRLTGYIIENEEEAEQVVDEPKVYYDKEGYPFGQVD
ncbi:hypothetical protein MUP77_06360 [Candidatus Bathyarchaeota archaeon]|nr:hypothetical protein [Candidatus Bathyarchaeota archaeon]